MSWRQALWERVALGDDGVTVMEPQAETDTGDGDGGVDTPEIRTADPRYTADEVPAITSVQLAGEQVTLVNISASGVLVESDGRIKPGERVKLSISGLTPSVVSGVVVRCVVSAIRHGGKLRYESGIAFGERVTLPLGPAALRTTPDAAAGTPAMRKPASTSPSLPSLPIGPALAAAAADDRPATPRVRNRW